MAAGGKEFFAGIFPPEQEQQGPVRPAPGRDKVSFNIIGEEHYLVLGRTLPQIAGVFFGKGFIRGEYLGPRQFKVCS
jgi:hypothetical protein